MHRAACETERTGRRALSRSVRPSRCPITGMKLPTAGSPLSAARIVYSTSVFCPDPVITLGVTKDTVRYCICRFHLSELPCLLPGDGSNGKLSSLHRPLLSRCLTSTAVASRKQQWQTAGRHPLPHLACSDLVFLCVEVLELPWLLQPRITRFPSDTWIVGTSELRDAEGRTGRLCPLLVALCRCMNEGI